MLENCKQRAKQKGIECTISVSDIPIPEFCPVLGIKLERSSKSDASPSVDRVNLNKGYVPGNVCVISMRANRLKTDSSLDELKKIIAYVEKHLTEA